MSQKLHFWIYNPNGTFGTGITRSLKAIKEEAFLENASYFGVSDFEKYPTDYYRFMGNKWLLDDSIVDVVWSDKRARWLALHRV